MPYYGNRAYNQRGVHIGNPNGLVAIWLDEGQCFDLAEHYSYPDTFGKEIIEAAIKAYALDEEKEVNNNLGEYWIHPINKSVTRIK